MWSRVCSGGLSGMNHLSCSDESMILDQCGPGFNRVCKCAIESTAT